jgi:replicative DNA helicase
VLLNDPQYVEAARSVAQLVIKSKNKTDIGQLLTELSFRILNRPLSQAELRVVQEAYREQREYFVQNPQAAQEYLGIGDSKKDPQLDPLDLAASSVVAGMLMCFDDFIMNEILITPGQKRNRLLEKGLTEQDPEIA